MKPLKSHKRAITKAVFLIQFFVVFFTKASADTIINSDWPMFQHDVSHTGQSSFRGIPSHPIEIWRTQLPAISGEFGSGMSMGADGTVYVSAVGNLYALNPQDGDIEWRFQYADNSRSTPTVGHDGMIFWGYGDSFVAITPTGQFEWGWTDLTGNYVFASSPVIDPDRNVYFSHDGIWSFTYTGEFRWFYPSGWFSHSSPAIGTDGTIYAATHFNEFVALRPDGTPKWLINVQAYDNSPTLASDGTIYLGVVNDQEGKPAKLLALNPDGTKKWDFLLDHNVYSIHMPPAISSNGTIYFGSGSTFQPDDTSYLYAMNPDGTLKWKLLFRAKDGQDLTPVFLAPPVIDSEGDIYVCSCNGSCYSVSPDGVILWEFSFPVDPAGYPVWSATAPLIVSDGVMLFLDVQSFVHAFVEPTSIIYLPAVFRNG